MALFKKIRNLEWAQNELIGKKIADIYGLICPKYYIVDLGDGNAEVYSEDLNTLGEFENNLVFDSDGTNLYNIGNRLDLSGYDASQIMPDVFKVYIMDMLFGNHDRIPSNWGIVRIDDEQRVVIFDNEMLFSKEFVPFIFANTNDFSLAPNYDEEDVIQARLNDIKLFLFNYDSRYIEIFRKLLVRITPERLEKIFADVEAEAGTKIIDRERKLKQYQEMFTKTSLFLDELDVAIGRK